MESRSEQFFLVRGLPHAVGNGRITFREAAVVDRAFHFSSSRKSTAANAHDQISISLCMWHYYVSSMRGLLAYLEIATFPIQLLEGMES